MDIQTISILSAVVLFLIKELSDGIRLRNANRRKISALKRNNNFRVTPKLCCIFILL